MIDRPSGAACEDFRSLVTPLCDSHSELFNQLDLQGHAPSEPQNKENQHHSAAEQSELTRLREEASFGVTAGIAQKQYVDALLGSPGKARGNDVSVLMELLVDSANDFTADPAFQSEASRALLQIVAQGATDDVKREATRAFLKHKSAGAEDPEFRRALIDYASQGKVDPNYANAIKRYAFRVDGESASSVPSRWENALVEDDKATKKPGQISDTPEEPTGRRDETVRAIEKIMPSFASIDVSKKTSWGRKSTTGGCVAIDDRGYLLTADHVVKGADTIEITTDDGKTVPAKVVLSLPHKDLAVIKIDKQIPETRLGPAARSDLLLGEKVIAVGNPNGYDRSVCAGILASKARSVLMPDGNTLENCIQLNAAINPGNSGGPLINRNGELIGIISAIREGSQSIGFAVNADDAQRLLAQEMSAEKLSKITHGIKGNEVVTKQEGPNRQYLQAANVGETSPAGKAGLKNGDRIDVIDGKPISNSFDVERAFWDAKAGQTSKLTITRNDKQIDLFINPEPVSPANKN
jgi:S1-C subfamily serine protease